MLKGISRQILEITQTENPYFERAFLVIRPVCQDFSAEQLGKAAHKFLQQQSPYSGLKRARQKQRLYTLICLLAGSALGATVVSVLLLLL